VTDDLMMRAQAGDHAAIEEVLASVEGLIWQVARRWYVDGFDHEDLMQEARIKTLDAIRTHDPRRGGAFSTHVTRCVVNHYKHLLKDSTRQKRHPGDPILSLDMDEQNMDERVGDDSLDPRPATSVSMRRPSWSECCQGSRRSCPRSSGPRW
jgi:RNA polymerase sigma factor (sigma-70 family)